MKNSLIVISVLLLTVVELSSCKSESRKALDIQLSEINPACEYVDAIELILDEMLETKGNGAIGQLSKSKNKKMIALEEKYAAIAKDAGDKFSNDELSQCSNFKNIGEKYIKLEDL